MKLSLRKGFSFGLTSGIITTLGMVVGLHSSTHSKEVVISGILVIAIADALSDSVGIHISEESEVKHSTKGIWESTITTFLSEFAFALTFIIPFLILPMSSAIVASVVWGLSLIVVVSFYLARKQGIRPYKVILEHVLIVIAVVIITHYIGEWARIIVKNAVP